MAKPKFPPKFSILGQVIDLRSDPEFDPDFDAMISAISAESELTTDIHQRLLSGAKNEVLGQNLAPALTPKQVANFLSELALTNNQKLVTTVRTGIKSLGIAPFSGGRGRPKGRNADTFYLAVVEKVRLIVEQKDIFSMKREIRAKLGTNWSAKLRRQLERDGWPQSDVHFLITSRDPRSFAINKASEVFDVSYDAIDRACRRAAKSAKR